MAWRNHETHKAETKAVKDALAKAGINASVTHGKGTGWGWLKIYIGDGEQYGEHIIDEYHSHRDCPRCKKLHEISRKAEAIAQEVTGRHGDYGGCINIMRQNQWKDKIGYIPIIQP